MYSWDHWLTPRKGVHLFRYFLHSMRTPLRLFPPHAYMYFYFVAYAFTKSLMCCNWFRKSTLSYISCLIAHPRHLCKWATCWLPVVLSISKVKALRLLKMAFVIWWIECRGNQCVHQRSLVYALSVLQAWYSMHTPQNNRRAYMHEAETINALSAGNT